MARTPEGVDGRTSLGPGTGVDTHGARPARSGRRPWPVVALLIPVLAFVAMTAGHSTGGVEGPGRGPGNLYFLSNALSGGVADAVVSFGRADDAVLVGDWDGDGSDTLAVRRGNDYLFTNSREGGPAEFSLTLGRDTDDVLVGDWDGDGTDTLAIRRGNAYHIFMTAHDGDADEVVVFGTDSDLVLVGDWDGDGRDTIAVRRGVQYLFLDSLHGGEADRTQSFGRATDQVMVGDWDGDGADTPLVRRGNSYWAMNGFDVADEDEGVRFVYGFLTDLALVGDWDGDGTDSTGVRRPVADPGQGDPSDFGQLDSMRALGNVGDYVSAAAPTLLGLPVGSGETVGSGWASDAVNVMPFRRSSIVTALRGDDDVQTLAYYDPQGNLVLARKESGTGAGWTTLTTQYTGNIADAHASISIAVDGHGYLHVAWGMHANTMQYARSLEPWSLELGPITPVTGLNEDAVTYPEFYPQSNGNLFLLYRDGGSGSGNLVVDHYDVSRKEWTQTQGDLVDGKSDDLSPYWQAVVDSRDRLQITWVWRSSGVDTVNRDLAYVRSTDATGRTWQRSDGTYTAVPITQARAETIVRIPDDRQLVNQTSMAVDDDDRAYVVSYWRTDGNVMQYMLVHQERGRWEVEDTGIRSTDFDLSGGGTKALPVGRPQILVSGGSSGVTVHLVLRDVERGNVATLATRQPGSGDWVLTDLTDTSLGQWEPNFDTARWSSMGELSILVQKAIQVDGEGLGFHQAEDITVLRLRASELAVAGSPHQE